MSCPRPSSLPSRLGGCTSRTSCSTGPSTLAAGRQLSTVWLAPQTTDVSHGRPGTPLTLSSLCEPRAGLLLTRAGCVLPGQQFLSSMLSSLLANPLRKFTLSKEVTFLPMTMNSFPTLMPGQQGYPHNGPKCATQTTVHVLSLPPECDAPNGVS